MSQYEIVKASIEGRLVVGGKSYDFLSVDISGGVNMISSAAISLPLGREVVSLQAAAIHSDGQTWTYMVPAEIWVKIEGNKTPNSKWAGLETKIFEGWMTQMTVQRAENAATAIIHLTHWLAGLTFGSIISPYFNPGNPGSYIQAAIRSQTGADGQNQSRSFSSVTAATQFQSDIEKDLWLGIKSFLQSVAKEGNIETIAKELEQTGLAFDGNKEASDILDFINPIDMKLEGLPSAARTEILRAAAALISSDAVLTSFQNSYWSKIVGQYAPIFMFAIIARDPKENGALCVPYLPGLRKTYTPPESEVDGVAITAADYFQGEVSRLLTRPIRSVVLTSIAPTLTNAATTREQPLIAQGGIFSPKSQQQARGTVLTLSAPNWLARPLQFGQFSAEAIGVNIKNATKGIQGNAQPVPQITTPKVIVEACSTMLSRYAQAIYVQEVLRERFMRVTGRLRFDICPGSTVRVDISKEKFIGNQDKLASAMIGCVQQYTISMNSESGTAMTTYQLSHVRSLAENEQESTSINEHPLFKTTWAGGQLVEGI